mmetsp:Transcript_22031/g.50897  ORF Transcript_22031/g.50897 Transcript_22031/m.50897 type:complete len:212 (-) Transcript_22031:75-710(-)
MLNVEPLVDESRTRCLAPGHLCCLRSLLLPRRRLPLPFRRQWRRQMLCFGCSRRNPTLRRCPQQAECCPAGVTRSWSLWQRSPVGRVRRLRWKRFGIGSQQLSGSHERCPLPSTSPLPASHRVWGRKPRRLRRRHRGGPGRCVLSDRPRRRVVGTPAIFGWSRSPSVAWARAPSPQTSRGSWPPRCGLCNGFTPPRRSFASIVWLRSCREC